MSEIKNELSPELIGIVALNPMVRGVSPARLAMFCSHIGQALLVKGATVNRLVSGVTREFAKDDCNIQFPCNATVVQVIKKYPITLADSRIKHNPITTIIYENADSDAREHGVIHIPSYHYEHQYFGFNYVIDSDIERRLIAGGTFGKGTVIAHSPAVTPSGDYAIGLEAQVAFMSVDTIIDDGIPVSESFADRCTTKAYGVRSTSFGRNSIPLNLYGDPSKPEQYKPFPDIGEVVQDNGLIFATRNYDESTAIPLLSRHSLRKVDFFDKPVHAPPGAKVIDVIVHKGNKDRTGLPEAMEEQCAYYYKRTLHYNNQILSTYYKLKQKYGVNVVVSPELSNLIVKAEVFTKLKDKTHIIPMYDKKAIDEWHVEIVYEYDIRLGIGGKLTDCNGGKGVVCDIIPDADMPRDYTGNVAELITDFDSTIKRMNPGRLYEHYINASGRYLAMQISDSLYNTGDTFPDIEALWEYILGFYKITSPRQYAIVNETIVTPQQKRRHLEIVARDGVFLFMPSDNPVNYVTVIDQLRTQYPAPYGPVQYRGRSGRLVTTVNNVLIGGMYYLLLEKVGNTWQSVASAKQQHFGIPAKTTGSDKFATPGRHNPVRIFGESEVRLVSAMCGGDITADILDQSNNPVVHRAICENILRSEAPTRIDKVIDRNKMPVGNGRIITLVKHVLECAGIKFSRYKGD